MLVAPALAAPEPGDDLQLAVIAPPAPPRHEWPRELVELASSDGSSAFLEGRHNTDDVLAMSTDLPLERPVNADVQPIDPRVLGVECENQP